MGPSLPCYGRLPDAEMFLARTSTAATQNSAKSQKHDQGHPTGLPYAASGGRSANESTASLKGILTCDVAKGLSVAAKADASEASTDQAFWKQSGMQVTLHALELHSRAFWTNRHRFADPACASRDRLRSRSLWKSTLTDTVLRLEAMVFTVLGRTTGSLSNSGPNFFCCLDCLPWRSSLWCAWTRSAAGRPCYDSSCSPTPVQPVSCLSCILSTASFVGIRSLPFCPLLDLRRLFKALCCYS